jgi:RNA polymerase sigma factor (sigma-70 family)
MNEHEAVSEVDSSPLSDSEPITSEDRHAAIERFVHQHNDALVNYVRRWVRSRADAHDIAQEAYARIFRLGDASVVSHLQGYLYRSAKNIALNWIRSRITQESFVQEESLRANQEDKRTPEQICMAKEELEAVKRAFKQLPPRTRMVVYLIKQDGMSYDEVALKLGIKTSSVRRLVERAMESLLEEVGRGSFETRGKR